MSGASHINLSCVVRFVVVVDFGFAHIINEFGCSTRPVFCSLLKFLFYLDFYFHSGIAFLAIPHRRHIDPKRLIFGLYYNQKTESFSLATAEQKNSSYNSFPLHRIRSRSIDLFAYASFRRK